MKDKKTVAQILGENLKRIRLANGVSRKELAEKLGVSQTTIASYENGIKTPMLEKVFLLAEILRVSVVSLTGENDFSDNVPNVDKKIFEYRLQRAIKILQKAECEVETVDGAYLVSFELNFLHSDDKIFSVKPKKMTLKISDAESLIKMVEKTAETLFSTKYSYHFRDFFHEIFKGATAEDLDDRIIADIK